MKIVQNESLKIPDNIRDKLQDILYFIFADPLEDHTKEKLRLQHTKAFYKMLGEYIRGNMDKTAFMNHIKTYLREWEWRRRW